jgi:hypothetical protein
MSRFESIKSKVKEAMNSDEFAYAKDRVLHASSAIVSIPGFKELAKGATVGMLVGLAIPHIQVANAARVGIVLSAYSIVTSK